MLIPDAVLGGLIGAAVSQLGAFGILYVTLRAGMARAREERKFRERQEHDADRRALRDQKYERLRRAYVTVVVASLALGQAVREYGAIWATEPAESRDARLNGLLSEALTDINRARAELMMETEGREVLETFDNVVWDAFISFRQGLAANAASSGSATALELKTHRDDLQSGLDALIKSARTRLSLLEQVLPE